MCSAPKILVGVIARRRFSTMDGDLPSAQSPSSLRGDYRTSLALLRNLQVLLRGGERKPLIRIPL